MMKGCYFFLTYDPRGTLVGAMERSHGLYGSKQKATIEVRGFRTWIEKLVETPTETAECRRAETRQNREVQRTIENRRRV